MKEGNTHPVEAAADEFSVRRILDAPRELVFAACTDPSRMAGW